MDSSEEFWEPEGEEMEQVRKTILEKNLRVKKQPQEGRWGHHGKIMGSALKTGVMEGSQGTAPQTLR